MLRRLLLTAVLVAVFSTSVAGQTSINVTDVNEAGVGCTLRKAIASANSLSLNGQSDPTCTVAGTGAPYTLSLPNSGKFLMNTADNYWYGPNALPAITTYIIIEGNHSLLSLGSSAGPRLRFFYVGADPSNSATHGFSSPGPGHLVLRNLQLQGGRQLGGSSATGGGGAGMGGAIFNQGILFLDRVALIGNTAKGGDSGVLSLYGTGGGMGEDGAVARGGGLGGLVTTTFSNGTYSGTSIGGSGGYIHGGGGGGFYHQTVAGALPCTGGNGCNADSNVGGNGGGVRDGLGGDSLFSGMGGAGAGAGGVSILTYGTVGNGGGFGIGGTSGEYDSAGKGGGGGGGVGAGGGEGGGGGGFGGGGGGGDLPGNGGFGGGGGQSQRDGISSGTDSNYGNRDGGFGGGTGGRFTGGAGAGMGGAVFNHGGQLTIQNSTLTGNQAIGGLGANGGYYAPGDALGGAVFNLNGTVVIKYSTIARNSALSNGSLDYVYPFFSGQFEFHAAGGGVFSLAYNLATAPQASLTISNSIVNENSLAPTPGGGDDVASMAPSAQTAASLTLADANIITSIYSFNTTVTGPNPIQQYAQLADLTNQSVPDYLAIGSGSPAIDAAVCDSAITVDELLTPRPQGASCDIGAYEATLPVTPTINISAGPFTYDATPHAATCSAVGTNGATVSGTCTVRYQPAGVPINAGSYSVYATFTSSDASYTNAQGYAPLIINQANLTITPDPKTKNYGQVFSAFTSTIIGLQGTDAVSVTYLSQGSAASALPGSYDILITQWAFTSGQWTNYHTTYYTAYNGLTVLPINQTITFDTAAPLSAPYNSTFPVAAHSDSGLAVTLAVAQGSSAVCSLGVPSSSGGITSATVAMISGSGACVITANQPGGSGYAPAAPAMSSTTAIKINQAALSLNPGSPLTYGATEPIAATGGSGTGAVSYTLTLGPCILTAGQLTAGLGFGSCQVTAMKLGDNNYNVATTTASVSLQKANLTIIPDAGKTKVYGQTFSGFTGSTTGLQGTDAISVVYDSAGAAATAAVGSYNITVASYTFTSGSATNYTVATPSKTGGLTVAKANLTIAPDGGKSKPYGQTFSAFTGSITGLQNSDAVTATYGSTGAPAAAAAGSYDITVTATNFTTGSGSNYNISTPPAVGGLTVVKANLTITVDGGKSKVYGQVFSAFTGSISGLQGSDAVAVNYASAGAASTALVGAYDITVAGVNFVTGSASNYSITSPPAAGGLIVSKANLTITADGGKSKIYGQTFTAFTASTSGLQGSDALSINYASLGAGPTAPVGSYDITVAGVNFTTGSASNYNITTKAAAGGLAVTQAALSITADSKTKLYLSALPAFTVQYSGLQNSDTPAALSGVLACTTTATQASPVGMYPITCSGLSSANYTIRYVGSQLTIASLPVAAAITLSSSTPQYSDKITINVSIPAAGGVAPAIGMNFKIGSVDLGTVPLAIAAGGYAGSITSAQLMQTPGVYTITASFVSPDADYALSYMPAPLSLTVTPEDARSIYTGPAYVNTPSVTSYTATIPLSFTIQDITAVGPYVAGTASTPASGDQAYDAWPGNINNATVKIVDALTNTTMCATTTLGVLTAGDTSTVTATCSFTASLPASGANAGFQTYTPQVVIGGNYVDAVAASEQGLLTVALPLNSNFVSGGGGVIESASSGLLPGALGSKTQFSLSVKYNKSGTTLQGNAYATVRSTVVAPGDTCKSDANGYHVYQFKANSIASLTTQTSGPSDTASLVAGASIVDITSNGTSTCSYPVDGGATLQITMTDKGSSGDTIAITVWQAANKGGNLWFSSNWVGGKTTELLLANGNLSVH